LLERLFKFGTICSWISCVLILLAWVLTGKLDPRKHYLTLWPDCHVSVSDFCGLQRVSFFNYPPWGPSVTGTFFVTGKGDPPLPGKRYLGGAAGWTAHPSLKLSWLDAPGIFYRRVQLSTGQPIWALSVSLWYPLVPSAILPAIWSIQQLIRRRARRGFAVIQAVRNP